MRLVCCSRDRSSGDGIVLLGNAQLSGAVLSLTSGTVSSPTLALTSTPTLHTPTVASTAGQTGAIWHTPRKVIDKGFSVSFSFRMATASGGSCNGTQREGFAFVIQNDTVPVLAVRNSAEGATFAGISNCLMIEVSSYTSAVSKDRRHQIAVYTCTPEQTAAK